MIRPETSAWDHALIGERVPNDATPQLPAPGPRPTSPIIPGGLVPETSAAQRPAPPVVKAAPPARRDHRLFWATVGLFTVVAVLYTVVALIASHP